MQTVKLEINEQKNYRIKEAYRTLRSNIEFCGAGTQIIAVTSCTPNEGKTSVAVNLAVAIAESGKKVMIIDADFRKSVMVGRYKTGVVKVGLTHCLVGQNAFTDVICKTNIKNLFIAFAGPIPPNPSELLGSEMFKMILGSLRSTFDYVIVDTPPLGSVIDGAVVARECDGVVMVIESNAISYKFAQQVKSQLEKAECKILGVILNKVDMEGNGYYGRYYGKYFAQYGGDKKTKE